MMTRVRIGLISIVLISLSSCSKLEVPITDGIEEFKLVSQDEAKKDFKILKHKASSSFSLSSNVKIENSISSRSFEQILLVKDQSQRVSWYAPNYVQTLAYLIQTKDKELYCDLTTNECWNSIPYHSELEGLQNVVEIQGMTFANLLLGLPIDLSGYAEVKYFKNPSKQSEIIIEASSAELKVVSSLIKADAQQPYFMNKMFVMQQGERKAEVSWIRSQEKFANEIIIKLLERGLTIKLNSKDFASPLHGETENIFELTPPSGFKLN